MSRRVYLLGVGLALVALALAFTDWALSLQPGVTEANARRIREGVTLAEVEGIFGRSPDRREGEGDCPWRYAIGLRSKVVRRSNCATVG